MKKKGRNIHKLLINSCNQQERTFFGDDFFVERKTAIKYVYCFIALTVCCDCRLHQDCKNREEKNKMYFKMSKKNI